MRRMGAAVRVKVALCRRKFFLCHTVAGAPLMNVKSKNAVFAGALLIGQIVDFRKDQDPGLGLKKFYGPQQPRVFLTAADGRPCVCPS